MDEGHTQNTGFEQNFMSGVNQAAMANPVTVQPQKKIPIFIITTVVFALATIVLIIVLIITNNRPNIAADSSENVVLSKTGNVEAIGVLCELDDGTLYLEKNNHYFIKTNSTSDTLIMITDGEYERRDSRIETGIYTVDGESLHLHSDDGDGFYATYSHHNINIKGGAYKCKNYD